MKKLLVLFLVTAALTACQKKQYFTASPEIDLVKKGADSYLKADWTTLRSLYLDTAEIHVNTWMESMNPDQFIEQEKLGVANYSSYKIGDDAIYEMVISDDGEHWVHTWLNHVATLKNGKTVSGLVHIATRVEGGKVTFQAFVADQLQGYLAAIDTAKAK